jgi:Ca2+-binding RTX toxin-like protein
VTDGDNVVLGDNGRVVWALVDGHRRLVLIEVTEPTLGGDDLLHGGRGNDVLIGGTGSDLILGIAGSNLIFGDHGQLVARTGSWIDLSELPLWLDVHPFVFTSTFTGCG